MIHVPLGTSRVRRNPRLTWTYESEPEPGLNSRRLALSTGRVFGGTSSINGVVYMRGHCADYDTWREFGGCIGWDWESPRRYFEKAENLNPREDEFGGPLRISYPRALPELADRWVAAAIEAGLPPNRSFNGAQQEGVGRFASTTTRSPLEYGGCLSATGAKAAKSEDSDQRADHPHLIEDGRAAGVTYVKELSAIAVRNRR